MTTTPRTTLQMATPDNMTHLNVRSGISSIAGMGRSGCGGHHARAGDVLLENRASGINLTQ
jgi:hypothetical protein